VPVLQETAPAPPDPERGKYLVHHVAMCVQCHSPRDEAGNLDRTRLLTGAPIPVSSPFRGEHWAVRAPSLAGMPGYTAEEMVRLLTKGVNRNGHIPLAPMPPF